MKKTSNKIVLGMDFSESAMSALEMSFKFAKIHDSEIILVYVLESTGGLISWMGRSDSNGEQRQEAQAKLNQLAGQHAERASQISSVIAEGSACKALMDIAESERAELMVIGTHECKDRGPLVGKNGIKVIRNAPCPVVTVKKIRDDQKLEKILIPVDKKFGIREIRSFLKDFKGKYNDKIDLLSIVSPKLGEDDEEMKLWKSHLHKQKIALIKLGFKNVDSNIVADKNIGSAISEFAAAHQNEIDLIMMETHGRSGLNRWAAGSVTEEVINHTQLPVFSLCPERRGSSFGASGY